MKHRSIGVILLVIGLFWGTSDGLWAGGWTAVMLDELPLNVKAGEPFTLGFMVRQHGLTPVDLDLNDAPILLTFYNAQSGQQIEVEAEKQGAVGHYVAEVVLPTAAEWALEIRPSRFPTVAVADVTVQPATGVWALSPNGALLQRSGALGAIIVALAAGFALVRQVGATRRRAAVGVLGLLFLVSILASGWLLSALAAASAAAEIELQAYGKALFEAKGCISCHLHDDVDSDAHVGSGPNLTSYTASPAFLRQWLADPQAVKPRAAMPNLQLSAVEIDALVQFLGANDGATAK